jgi:hypothetical protein
MKYISQFLALSIVLVCCSSKPTHVENVCNDNIAKNDTINPFEPDTTKLDNMTIICHYELYHNEDPETGEYVLVSVYTCDTITK